MLNALEVEESETFFEEEDEVPTIEEFSFYLTNIREILGLTRLDMAALLNCKKNSYYNYEQGKNFPRNWKKYQEFLNGYVKEYFKKLREEPTYNTITEALGEEIIAMHLKQYNVVQIGMKLDIEETEVADYLREHNYEPISFIHFN